MTLPIYKTAAIQSLLLTYFPVTPVFFPLTILGNTGELIRRQHPPEIRFRNKVDIGWWKFVHD